MDTFDTIRNDSTSVWKCSSIRVTDWTIPENTSLLKTMKKRCVTDVRRVDNIFHGENFERPKIQYLLQLAKSKKAKTYWPYAIHIESSSFYWTFLNVLFSSTSSQSRLWIEAQMKHTQTQNTQTHCKESTTKTTTHETHTQGIRTVGSMLQRASLLLPPKIVMKMALSAKETASKSWCKGDTRLPLDELTLNSPMKSACPK